MKFDINNPAFLQAAGSVSTESSIVARFADRRATFYINRGTGGTVSITRTLDGVLSTYSEDIDTTGALSLTADPRTDITVRGDITSLTDEKDEGTYVTLGDIDISKCRNLELLFLGSNLQALSVIKARATYVDVADGIAAAIIDSEVAGVVYLKQGDEFNNVVLTAAQDSGWEVRYF